MQIGGRGQAVVFDGYRTAPVGAGTLEQRDRRLRLARPGEFWLRCAHDTKCTDSTEPHKPFAPKGSQGWVTRALSWCDSRKIPFYIRTERSVTSFLDGTRPGGCTGTRPPGAAYPGQWSPAVCLPHCRAAAASPG